MNKVYNAVKILKNFPRAIYPILFAFTLFFLLTPFPFPSPSFYFLDLETFQNYF